MLSECTQLADFPTMIQSALCKWCKNLGFCYKKVQACQQLDVDNVLTAYSFSKIDTLALVFSCKIVAFFQVVTLLKVRLRHKCFLVNFTKFLRTLNLQKSFQRV